MAAWHIFWGEGGGERRAAVKFRTWLFELLNRMESIAPPVLVSYFKRSGRVAHTDSGPDMGRQAVVAWVVASDVGDAADARVHLLHLSSCVHR